MFSPFVNLSYLSHQVVYRAQVAQSYEMPSLEAREFAADVEDFSSDPRLLRLMQEAPLRVAPSDEEKKYSLRKVPHHEVRFKVAGQNVIQRVYDQDLAEAFDYNDLMSVFRESCAGDGLVRHMVLVRRGADGNSLADLLLLSVQHFAADNSFVVNVGYKSKNTALKEYAATLVRRAHGELRNWMLRQNRSAVASAS